MLKTLEDITKRIVQGYEPERIILYGSQAKTEVRPDSDIDLLIIKETTERPIDRRIHVEKILSDRMVPLDIMVYTPREFRYLFSLGSPFIEEIVKEGRVVYMRKVTESWLNDARDELESASVLFEHDKYRGSCYHSQQCVEKGLKAVILEKGKSPERTHDILELFNEVTSLGWDVPFSMDEAIFLSSIYKARYPTEEGLLPYGEPSNEDAERALSSARNLMESLKNMMP